MDDLCVNTGSPSCGGLKHTHHECFGVGPHPQKAWVRKVMNHNENNSAAPQPVHLYYQTSKLVIDVRVFDYPNSIWWGCNSQPEAEEKGLSDLYRPQGARLKPCDSVVGK